MRSALFAFALVNSLFALLAPATVGFATPGYNSAHQFISELGAARAPRADMVNYGIFLPTAILTFVCIAWLVAVLPRHVRLPALLLIGLPIGYFGAVGFPCDAGCPAQGSPQQAIHNFAGLVSYVSGAVSMIWMRSRWNEPAGVYLGIFVLLSLIMMGGPGVELRGMWQRIAELCLFAWIPYCAWKLMRTAPPRPHLVSR